LKSRRNVSEKFDLPEYPVASQPAVSLLYALKTKIILGDAGAALAAMNFGFAAVSIPHPTCRVVDCLTLLKAAPAHMLF
jgi:hypothetical protein